MKKLLLLLLFLALIIVSCSPDDEKELPFYVADNGVTIKVRDWTNCSKQKDRHPNIRIRKSAEQTRF